MASKCSRCGKPLTDPFSMAIGMGPDCRGGLSKKGWRFPKPVYAVRGGRVVLDKVIGKVERPPAGDLTDREGEQAQNADE